MLYYPGRARVVDSNGDSVSNAKLSFYESGTTDPAPVYIDSDLEDEHTQPVRSNAAGFYPPIYLDPGVIYKSIETTADDVSLPGGTVDPVASFSQDAVGQILNPRSPAEIAASVTPTNSAVPNDSSGMVFEARYASAADAALVVAEADLQTVYAGGFYTGVAVPGSISQFYSRESITDHAHYGFLDESVINYAGGAPIYGHASFDDNVTIEGVVASDHHHSFQAYPHYTNSATISRIAGFYGIGDHTGAGTVTSYAQFWAEKPQGAGPINNFYGYYCAPIGARAVGNNYAFYAEGTADRNLFAGPVQLGAPATPATIQYEYVSGNLELIPRSAYKIHVKSELLIGAASEVQSASLKSDGDLTIRPRTGFNTVVASPLAATGPITLPSFTVAQLGSTVLPADWPRAMVYVSNETGGATVAYSNGTNWKRVYDNANIS